MKAAVPLCTLLGPITFLMHINDLTIDCDMTKYVGDAQCGRCVSTHV